jgi:hypothetical protein
MKTPGFSFKNEAIWIMLFALAPFAVALLLLAVAWLVRSAR